MNPAPNSKSFIFNQEIDPEHMNALYGDDYAYIEEVFDTVLQEYDPLAIQVMSSYEARNIPALKAAVHKIKPIFGFVGMTQIQQQCQQFEQVCQDSSSFEAIDQDFGLLKNKLIGGKQVIEEEKKKLASFNSNLS